MASSLDQPGEDAPVRSGSRRRIWYAVSAPLFVLGLLVLTRGTPLSVGDPITSLYFSPVRGCPPPPPDAGAVDVVSIPGPGGASLEGWWFPSANGRARALVVLAHGNGSNMSKQWHPARDLADRGLDVLLFDYRGFGNSPGRATRSNALADIRAAMGYGSVRALQERLPLVLAGQSMGGALSIEASRGATIDAIVVDSPFSSWAAIAAATVTRRPWLAAPIRWSLDLFVGGADPIAIVPRLQPPLLVITGTADPVTPTAMAQALIRARPGTEELVLDGAMHVGHRTPEESARVADTIRSFIDRRVAAQGSR